MKIAVFLPNWLGDLVMATPTLRAMRRHFGPEARLVGILRPNLADVLADTGWLSEQWYLDPRSGDAGMGRWALVRRLRRERFDMAVLLPHSLHSALLAWLGGARRRVGYVRDGRGLLLTNKVYASKKGGRWEDVPVVDYSLRLAEAVGCPPESSRLELHTTAADERSADEVFGRLGLPADGRVIALNGGSANSPARQWPLENFGQLARRIADRLGHSVLVMCGPKERDSARRIVELAKSPAVCSMADQPMDLGTAKACLHRCRMLVSTDSGPRHVAAALGRPVITLYGPTPAVWSANPTVEAVDLQLGLDCLGCVHRSCPLGHHRCMRELSVDVVYAAAAKVVEGAGKRQLGHSHGSKGGQASVVSMET